jgi:2-succinyl-5-enolpyruvyl-6-hydroxy-3-cyclohexene-1-carboxylate synthase
LTFEDHIHGIAELCINKGIRNVVICPGSRSAPLTLSFARAKNVKPYIIYDERVAAYMALGMALATHTPTALICTSGTAVLNFYPAVAEAYWQQIPLLILTGDRPPEWIGQGEGQSIRQVHVFEKNCKASYNLPIDRANIDSAYMSARLLNEALWKVSTKPYGPVHVNIPFREPFYPRLNSEKSDIKNFFVADVVSTLSKDSWCTIIEILLQNPKKMVLIGQLPFDESLATTLNILFETVKMPVLVDINSNLLQLPNTIHNYDQILAILPEESQKALLPDVLITFGNELLSKRIKKYFRKNKPRCHIHIGTGIEIYDTFQSVTHVVPIEPNVFFKELISKVSFRSDKDYYNLWLEYAIKVKNNLKLYFKKGYNTEIDYVNQLLQNLPANSVLHLANSMAVRYAAICGTHAQKILCNRGTSGIDGSNSTAVGYAIHSQVLNLLIIGDMSFLYDKNAFWHDYVPSNLRIAVINNGGGGIFRMVEGANIQPELETYFITKQPKNAALVCKDYGIEYTSIHSKTELAEVLKNFYKLDGKAKLIEIFIENATLATDMERLYTILKSN